MYSTEQGSDNVVLYAQFQYYLATQKQGMGQQDLARVDFMGGYPPQHWSSLKLAN